jgi:hypothetical protein
MDAASVRIFFVLFQETKKPLFLDPQNGLNVFPFNFVSQITRQEFFNLVRSKWLVYLRHNLALLIN